MIRPIAGLSEVASLFDGFILDLWGVVHDGQTPYPATIATLAALRKADKKTLLLSNAPRRAHALVTSMAAMGIGRDLYGEVLSSGEATRDALIARTDGFFAGLGDKAFHLGPERDRSVFEGTSLSIVERVEDATCVINTGPHGFEDTVEMYRDILVAARARDLPMVCANPDLVVIRAGRPVVCAGALAAEYAAMGGRVANRGKPDRAVYDAAVAQLGIADRKRVAVVGDALETDVRGANGAGLPAIWCTGGIHAAVLGVSYGVAAVPDEAEKLAFIHGVSVDFTIPGFFW